MQEKLPLTHLTFKCHASQDSMDHSEKESQNDFGNFMKLQHDIISTHYLPKSELLKFIQLIFNSEHKKILFLSYYKQKSRPLLT